MLIRALRFPVNIFFEDRAFLSKFLQLGRLD